MPPSAPLARDRPIGLLCLLVTAVGWGLNWPVMKALLREWPPLSARGWAGLRARLGRGDGGARARPAGEAPWGTPRRPAPRGRPPPARRRGQRHRLDGPRDPLPALAERRRGGLLVYTMPIWAALLAWPVLGERPTLRGVAALTLGVAGVAVLLGAARGGGGFAVGAENLPGVLLALGAAVLFALGAVTSQRAPLALPPLAAVAWQVGIGCLPMVVAGLVFERPDPHALTTVGWAAMAYMTVVPTGVCYLGWFAALRRLPPATASVATLLTPLVGVVAAALALGEPLGIREVAALGLTLGVVALALGKT